MKNMATVFITILLISAIMGCTNTKEPEKDSSIYGSTFVNFQMPDGWELHPMPGEGTVIWMGRDPRIRVIELKNKEKFNSAYKKALNTDTNSYNVIKRKKTIGNIEVNIIKTTSNMNGDIQDEYFFKKNNKYYHLVSWAFTGWNGNNQTSSRKEIDKATDTIIKTIK
ncbi:MAG: hypothetical protein QMD61_04735 [Methanobacterium sp.]|nr:hypothetical protein [Methanobacterium sp.]